MTLNKLNPATQFGLGSVVQVVSASDGSSFNTSSTSYVDTPVYATITPHSITNKIWALVCSCAGCFSSASDYFPAGTIARDSTDLNSICQVYSTGRMFTNANSTGMMTVAVLDSPASISALTYRLRMKSAGPLAGNVVGLWSNPSTITLMEIAA